MLNEPYNGCHTMMLLNERARTLHPESKYNQLYHVWTNCCLSDFQTTRQFWFYYPILVLILINTIAFTIAVVPRCQSATSRNRSRNLSITKPTRIFMYLNSQRQYIMRYDCNYFDQKRVTTCPLVLMYVTYA